MQHGWERRHPFLDLTPAAIRELVRRGDPSATVRSAEPLPGGLRNTNYRIELRDDDTQQVLRIYTADASACRREAALLSLLRACVPVPVARYVDPDADPPYALHSWIEGIPFDQLLEQVDAASLGVIAREAGRVLADIHSFTFPEPGFFGPDLQIREPFHDGGDGWRGYMESLLFRGRAGALLGDELRARLWDIVIHQAARLDVLRGHTTLVHADFKPWNLLVNRSGGEWRIAGVLDWEFALAGPPLLDVAIFLRNAEALPAPYAEGFEEGYRAGGGRLPDDWRALAELLDLLNLCSLLDHPSGGSALIEEVRGLIATQLDRL